MTGRSAFLPDLFKRGPEEFIGSQPSHPPADRHLSAAAPRSLIGIEIETPLYLIHAGSPPIPDNWPATTCDGEFHRE